MVGKMSFVILKKSRIIEMVIFRNYCSASNINTKLSISVRASSFNKRKIFNDPVYGFIPIESELVFDIIEHPYFQRLRRIKQLGLTHLVYPGALHTRFHHSIGAMYLMNQVIAGLRLKNHKISTEDSHGASLAILLHDIGHGPFSHALERSILDGMHHETLSRIYMHSLNQEFNGSLDTALTIFEGHHPKMFLHQLVSSQLDVDRMDYLGRDSFFTGVSEGVINTERIIKMLTINDNQVAVEEKGIYSIEKYIVARRLMYWQVYLHKTVIAAESMLVKILSRAKQLTRNGEKLFATPSLQYFLAHSVRQEDLDKDTGLLDIFSKLDDFDIFTSVKVWADHPDPVLGRLCKMLVNRHLFRIEMQQVPFERNHVERIREHVKKSFRIGQEEADYFIVEDSTANYAYHPRSDKINILKKNGEMVDLASVSDQLNISVLHKHVVKYFLCYPKNL
jgi:HD superfamily phosphohydrolase